ncbi:MAG: hypothetical protein LDL07_14350, partial [Desulfarculus sp.]|nr:hypothetical protein [Desulfarculus sp.]
MSKRIPFWLNNCVKFIFSLQVVLMFLIANGCAVGYKTGLIPRHSVDKSITSVEYYRSTMGVDLLSQDADLNDKINNKIRSARHADEIVGK